MLPDSPVRAIPRPGLARIAVLYALGLAALACSIVGGAMAWEAITWQPTTIGELPPMLLQFCIGGAAASASGLLAISCLVPALVFHAERRFSEPSLPVATVVGKGWTVASPPCSTVPPH